MISMPLEIKKEECLVAPLIDTRNIHWTAQSNPKLIAVRIRFLGLGIQEIVSGIERSVAQIVIHVAMQLAAARLRDDAQHISCAPAVLRCERMLLNLELLHIVR